MRDLFLKKYFVEQLGDHLKIKLIIPVPTRRFHEKFIHNNSSEIYFQKFLEQFEENLKNHN